MERRYVSRRHIKLWTLETHLKAKRPHQTRQGDAMDDQESSFLFQTRPWRDPEGVVNLSLVQQLLQTVITFLIRHPGIHLSRLLDRFNPDLLPTTVLELVQILGELGCVRTTVIKTVVRTRLFGGPGRHTVEETLWVREGRVVVDLEASSSLRFALFVEHLQSHPNWTQKPSLEEGESEEGKQDTEDTTTTATTSTSTTSTIITGTNDTVNTSVTTTTSTTDSSTSTINTSTTSSANADGSRENVGDHDDNDDGHDEDKMEETTMEID